MAVMHGVHRGINRINSGINPPTQAALESSRNPQECYRITKNVTESLFVISRNPDTFSQSSSTAAWR